MHDKDELREIIREEIGPVAEHVGRIDDRVGRLEGIVAQQASALTTCANAVADALAAGLAAQRAADEAQDASAKMIASAIEQQRGAVASVVAAAVSDAIKPMAAEVTALKDNDKLQNATLSAQNATLGAQNNALVIVARDMGRESSLDTEIRKRSLPPGSGEPPPPQHPVLPTLDRRSKLAAIAQTVIAVGFVAQLIYALLFPR